jgi:hypothetical protein
MSFVRFRLAPVGETVFPPRAPFVEVQPVEPPGSPGHRAPSPAHWAEVAQ